MIVGGGIWGGINNVRRRETQELGHIINCIRYYLRFDLSQTPLKNKNFEVNELSKGVELWIEELRAKRQHSSDFHLSTLLSPIAFTSPRLLHELIAGLDTKWEFPNGDKSRTFDYVFRTPLTHGSLKNLLKFQANRQNVTSSSAGATADFLIKTKSKVKFKPNEHSEQEERSSFSSNDLIFLFEFYC